MAARGLDRDGGREPAGFLVLFFFKTYPLLEAVLNVCQSTAGGGAGEYRNQGSGQLHYQFGKWFVLYLSVVTLMVPVILLISTGNFPQTSALHMANTPFKKTEQFDHSSTEGSDATQHNLQCR